MTRAEEYRQRAEEAERSAARVRDPEERAAFQKIAKGWRELERAERKSAR